MLIPLIHPDHHISTEELMSTLPLYPHSQQGADTMIPYKSVGPPWSNAHDDGLEFALIPVDFDTVLGEQRSMLAEVVSNHPPDALDRFDIPGGQDIVEDTELCINPGSLSGAGPVTKRPLAPSRSRKSSQGRHVCVVCSRSFDRIQRANDCANRDLGLEPYVCGGECKTMNWYILRLEFI
ncbi:hypothetical protein M408DRAFT_334310 [Serendipita vermifera MAFF 305830]|uniref:Uncharacterized protein n=1 Tax=Serendipita vermifera MAFF 305830 TaxID=933852 RepID=A0A0C2WPW9_SERVB|nr:hypothetical protein M408DRAFT_334310 [Serendipita vermifera MAFF 305830]